MKIDILSIQNLNSLSGKSEIHFNKKPFNSSGLFAITGPTGAGKSTIFDAICLALYGRTPRLKNPDEIMSRHSSECYTELTFSVNGKTYRSRWEQRRSRGQVDGKLQNSKMHIVDLNSENHKIIEDKKSAVPQVISEITGLDYDQFTRSILLAQGNFTSFLKAGINERADLLEKMTGSGIYTKISIEAFNRSKSEDEKLRRLKDRLGDTEILSIELRNQYTNEYKEKLNKRDHVRIDINTLTENQKWFEKEVLLKHRLDSSRYDLEDVNKKIKEAEPRKKEFYRLQKIVEYLPVYESYIYNQSEIERLLISERELITEKKQIVENVQIQNDLVEEKRQSLVESYKKIELIQETIEEVQSVVNILNSKNELLNSNVIKINDLNKELELIQQEINNDDRTLNTYLKKESALYEYLESHKNYANINEILPLLIQKIPRYFILKDELRNAGTNKIDNIDSMQIEAKNLKIELDKLREKITIIKDEQPDERIELETNKEILLKLSPISREYNELLKEIESYVKDESDYAINLKKTLDNVEQIKEKILVIKKEIKLNSLHNHVNKIKISLSDGDKCPVCNGTYQYSGNFTEQINESESEKKLERQQAILQKNQTQIGIIEEQISALNKNKIIANNRLNELMEEWILINNSRFSDLKPNHRDSANKIYKENDSKILILNNWEKECNSLLNDERNKTEEYEIIRSDLEKAQSFKKLKTEIFSLENEILNNIKPFNIDLAEEKTINQLNSFYKAYCEKKSISDEIKPEINNVRNELEINKKLTEQISLRLIELKNDNKIISNEIENLNKKIEEKTKGETIEILKKSISSLKESTQVELELSQKKLSSSRENLSHVEGKLNNLHSELPKLREQFDRAQKQLFLILKNEKMEELDFKQEGSKELLEQIKSEFETLNEKKIRAEEIFNITKNELHELQNLKPESQSLSEVSESLKNLKEEIETSSRSIGILEEKLKTDDDKRLQMSDLSESIENQEIDCLKWSKLKNLIGSADGKIYKRFVQGLTLEKLVQLANIHLLKLNNRYKIERSETKELEIEIVDCWQANTIRPSTTLSGGESFLVSLALSLGLSELVGNKVVIDSLFLDEGFGTLDPDTLETVLSALETLQSSGKLIGIISHIEAIRERISVQIKVKKLAGGRSVLEIV